MVQQDSPAPVTPILETEMTGTSEFSVLIAEVEKAQIDQHLSFSPLLPINSAF